MAGPIASLNAALRWDLADFDRGTRHIEMSFGKLLTIGRDMAASFQQIGQRMTLGITAPMVALAGFTVNAASNLQELQSAFDYTFGASAASMNAWAESTGNAMGRATSEMKAGALAMGQLFKQAAPTEAAAARLSQRFAALAQDAASFYNTSFDEAIGKIRSGLSGESEPLRDFGVFLTEAAVKAKALELGMIKVGEELTEQGKIMARSVLITEGLSDANGDVERTSGSFANRVRALKANIQELAEEIGERFLPYAEKLVGWAQGAVEWIGNLPPAVKDAAVGFGIFAAALGPLMLGLGALATTVLPLFLANMGPVFLAISALINPLGTAIVLFTKFAGEAIIGSRAMGLLVNSVMRFATPWGLALSAVLLFSDSIGGAISTIGALIREDLGPPVQRIIEQFGAAFSELGDLFNQIAESGFGQALGEIARGVGWLVEGLLVLGGYPIIAGISALLDMIEGIAEYVRGVVQTVSRLLQGDWEGAWQAAGNTVARAVQRIANLIRGVMPWLAGALDLMAKLTGDGSPLGSSSKGKGTGWSGSAIGFMTGAASKATEAAEAAGVSYAMPGGGGGGSRAGGGGRTGPSAAELADRREELKLDQALAIAREKNDIEGERALRRQLDLRSKIEQYTRAGLDASAAKLAAEKDMTELDQARAEANARAIAREERSIDIQLAELRNDYESIRFLKDEEFLERQILMWREKGLSIAEAERQAAIDLKNLEQARAEQISRRLADQEDARQIELARMRGDDPRRITALDERRRIRDRADELQSQGVNIEDAQAQAIQEGAERSKAALTGTFRDTFRAGLQAAMNGDLGGFFKNWVETRAFDALAKVLDRLADGLANLVSGGGGGGGLFGSILGLAGAVGGLGAGVGKGVGSIGKAAASAGKSASLPKFNSGGWGTIKGFAGIDTNVLSLNDNPIAMVSSGELLNVQKAGDGAARAVQSAVRVVLEDTTGLFKTRVETISSDVSSSQISAARPAIAADGASAAVKRIARMQDRGL